MTVKDIEKIADPMERLRTIVHALRAPDGCPWDREQTHQSLAICLVEECSEVLETIDHHDLGHMREELGDLLLQVVLHAEIASEEEAFTFDDLVAELNEKLVRRHPHVFGDGEKESSPTDAVKRWDAIKAQEKAAKGIVENQVFTDLPPALPATLFALKTYKKIQKNDLFGRCGIDHSQLQAKTSEWSEEALGAAFFELVCIAREKGLDPETLLRQEARKYIAKVEGK